MAEHYYITLTVCEKMYTADQKLELHLNKKYIYICKCFCKKSLQLTKADLIW